MAFPDSTAGARADLAQRREFGALREEVPLGSNFELHGGQIFVSGFMSPHTPYQRLLLNWDTGSGKTLAALAAAVKFVQDFRRRPAPSRRPHPTVTVVGFTRAVVVSELIRRPELGFVSRSELNELGRLAALAARAGLGTTEARRYSGFLGSLRRRLVDPERGGFFQFFGYREFANRLFLSTPLGIAKGFQVDSLVAEGEGTAASMALIARAEAAGLIRINSEVLDSLRQGLLIADEVHNVYNMRTRNLYGAALQFALDVFGDDGPRAIFMSATPLSGSPGEIVDLLNLLVPKRCLPGGRPLKRSNMFAGEQFAPGALALIEQLAAGRVSYRPVAPDAAGFAALEFEGEPLKLFGELAAGFSELPYLKFVLCPASPLHVKALAAERAGRATDLEPGAAALYDVVFPGPPDGELPALWREAPEQLARADPAWLRERGIALGDRLRDPPGGSWLAVNGPGGGLAAVSGKYARLLDDLLAAMTGPGKELIFHPYVRGAGVMFLANVLRANGFVERDGVATAATRCARCAQRQSKHGSAQGCDFAAARFGVLSGELDPSSRERILRDFNSPGNIAGNQMRVLLGSRIIQEGLNFMAVQRLYVASQPVDISALIQLLGRPRRRGAHSDLPPEERRVSVRIYVTTLSRRATSAAGASPEVVRLVRKMRAFLLIQEASRALRAGAVDSWLAPASATSLNGLAFTPAARPADPGELASYYAFGAARDDAARAARLIRTLFMRAPVWSRAAIAAELRGGLPGDPRTAAVYSEGLIDLALAQLTGSPPRSHGPSGGFQFAPHFRLDGAPVRIVAAGCSDGAPVYALAPLDEAGRPAIEPETLLHPARLPAGALVSLTAFLNNQPKNFGDEAAELLEGRLEPAAFLLQPAEVHYELCRRLLAGRRSAAGEKAAALYLAFGAWASANELKKLSAVLGRQVRAAYITERDVRAQTRDGETKLPLASLGRPVRPENSICVGYSEAGRGGAQRFKLRAPIQDLEGAGVRDARSLARGAVCSSRSREELAELCRRLKLAAGGKTAEICRRLLGELLARERKARPRGERWFFLFFEELPVIKVR